MTATNLALRPLKLESRQAARERGIAAGPNLTLVPVGPWILVEPALIEEMADWRWASRERFFAQFPRSAAGMRDYLQRVSIDRDDAILFILEEGDGNAIGHIGLTGVTEDRAEVDSVMRGRAAEPRGAMRQALDALRHWAENDLGVCELSLRVMSTNSPAIRLYESAGFSVRDERWLRREEAGGRVEHTEVPERDANVPYTCLVMAFDQASSAGEPT